MKSTQNLWAAYQLSKTYNCRPSQLMHIEDPLAAYYFDRAIAVFGIHLENEIEQAEAKGKSASQKAMKRNMVLNKYLGIGKFAKPAVTGR